MRARGVEVGNKSLVVFLTVLRIRRACASSIELRHLLELALLLCSAANADISQVTHAQSTKQDDDVIDSECEQGESSELVEKVVGAK